jgi:cobalt-zinc-cadmium efflux system membrane fusion protein
VEGERILFPNPQETSSLLSLIPAQAGAERVARIPGRLVWDEERTVRVRSPFAGKAAEILAQLGAKVSKGQTLALLYAPDFGAAQADLSRDQAEFSRKQKALTRSRELHEHGVAARKELEEAEADFEQARSELERARARLKLYGATGQGVDERFALKSPLSGVVVEKNINPGQEVLTEGGAQPLFVVTDPATLWVMLEANEADLNGIDLGEPIKLMARQYPDQIFSGVIDHIADTVDPETRTVKIRGCIPNPERKLKAEMFVTAEVGLPPETHPLIPNKALVMAGAESYVFVGDPAQAGAFARRKVQIGPEDHGMTPVLSGLAAGEKVVAEGAVYLQQLLQTARNKP